MKKLIFTIAFLALTVSLFSQFENQFYFRFGLSKPTKTTFGVDNDAVWDDMSRGGGVFEVGSIFMLNSLPLGDAFCIGVNADYAEFTYHQFKIDDLSTTGIFSIASKVGPSFSFNPVGDLYFDAALKLKVQWFSGLAQVYDESTTIDNEAFVGALGLGFATGLNVRYKFLMLAFEYNKANMKLINADDDTVYFGNASDDSDVTPLKNWNITFGFSF